MLASWLISRCRQRIGEKELLPNVLCNQQKKQKANYSLIWRYCAKNLKRFVIKIKYQFFFAFAFQRVKSTAIKCDKNAMSDLYYKWCYVTTTISFWTKDQFSDLFLCTWWRNLFWFNDEFRRTRLTYEFGLLRSWPFKMKSAIFLFLSNIISKEEQKLAHIKWILLWNFKSPIFEQNCFFPFGVEFSSFRRKRVFRLKINNAQIRTTMKRIAKMRLLSRIRKL